jgi:transposase
VPRDAPMLLPPDLRDWLPEDHLAWLVLDVVGQLDLSAISGTFRRGSTGREAYEPAMLTALLVYGYCQGVRSSRMIERACLTDVAFRVIAAQQRPDHTTIARFRARHAAALADLFGQVLSLCGKAGLGQVGIVAVDGTKIAGQASARKNYSEKRLRELAADIIAEARSVDAREDAEHGAGTRGDELPPELAPGAGRAARIRRALQQVEAERDAAVAGDVEAAERKLVRARRKAQFERDWVDRQRRPEQRRARIPVEEQVKVRKADARVAAVEAELAQAKAGTGRRARAAKPTANVSDPDSHIMFVRGKGYLQGYNAQIAVSDDHLILTTDVTTATGDRPWFVPMMNRAMDSVAEHLPGRQVGVVVADAGYCSIEALTAAGPDRLIATGRKPDEPSQPSRSEPITTMAQRLKPDSPDRARYSRRQATVEPVIGQLKDRVGLRRFARRGLRAARHELALAALAYNIRRLATV